MHHRHPSRLVAGSLLLLLSIAGRASAQASLVSGLGGAAGFGTSCLSPNDDGSSDPIDLRAVFPNGIHFYGTDAAHTHTRMFVNTNGNITFGAALAEFSPHAFPVAAQPMIAPYWADVDIRRIANDACIMGTTYRATVRVDDPNTGALTTVDVPCMSQPCSAGSVLSRADGHTYYCTDATDDGRRCVERSYTGAPGNGACLNPTSNGVWWNVDAANGRVIVTWDDVNYFSCEDDAKMAFQLVLTRPSECAAEGDFDVEFRYATCEWNTGYASGGGTDGFPARRLCGPGETPSNGCAMPAQAGFDAGDTTNFTEIGGSRTNEIHTRLCSSSNVGQTGVWRFQIRSGRVICPGAGGDCVVPGAVGACAMGVTSCVGSGTECSPLVEPSDERCDGIDNDCDGMVDDDDPACGAGETCTRGRCVPVCFEGLCGEGFVCDDVAGCIEFSCLGVTCEADEVCSGGRCRDACDGVVCPADQSCRAGRCIDVCDQLSCDPTCSICSDGACVARCGGDGDCAAGETCLADGRCEDSRCVGVTCGDGGRCEAGACVDGCEGVICPTGQSCSTGRCRGIDDPGPSPDPGPTTPGGSDGGGLTPGAAGRGCGCAVGADPLPSSTAAFALAALAALVVSRRRARR